MFSEATPAPLQICHVVLSSSTRARVPPAWTGPIASQLRLSPSSRLHSLSSYRRCNTEQQQRRCRCMVSRVELYRVMLHRISHIAPGTCDEVAPGPAGGQPSPLQPSPPVPPVRN